MSLPRVLCLSALCASGCASIGGGPPVEPRLGSVTPQDFFFYSCVREYMRAQSIPVFDGSTAYAVEYIESPHEVLTRLHKAAEDYARTIPAPDYTDAEHGLPAVLVRCREQAQTDQVAQLVRDGQAEYVKRASK